MFRIFSGNWRGFGADNGQATMFMQIGLEFRNQLHHFKGAPLAVFMAIALHSDQDGFANPSYDLLQRETGLARDTVARAIDHLCNLEIAGQRVLLQYRERDPETKRFYGSSRYIIFPTPEQIAKYETPKKKELPAEPELDFPTLAKSNDPELDFSEVGKSNLNNNHILNNNFFSLSESEKIFDENPQQSNPTEVYLRRAEELYRRLRPSHLIIPRSWHYEEALEVLNGTLEKFRGNIEAAEEYLRPFVEEADRRGISPTNLCWLAEWAAAGKIPRQANTRRGEKSDARKVMQSDPEEDERLKTLIDVDELLLKYQVSEDERDRVMKYLNRTPFRLWRIYADKLRTARNPEVLLAEFERVKREVGHGHSATVG